MKKFLKILLLLFLIIGIIVTVVILIGSLMIGGLSGITLMCMCIISKKSDLELVSYEKNKTEEHKTNK